MISRFAGKDTQSAASPAARILVLQASADVTNQYIACMNTIFSAQRLNVTIDGIAITPAKSAFIEQVRWKTVYMTLCAGVMSLHRSSYAAQSLSHHLLLVRSAVHGSTRLMQAYFMCRLLT